MHSYNCSCPIVGSGFGSAICWCAEFEFSRAMFDCARQNRAGNTDLRARFNKLAFTHAQKVVAFANGFGYAIGHADLEIFRCLRCGYLGCDCRRQIRQSG